MLTVVLGATVEPNPSPSPTARVLEDWQVTPGLEGFLATFAVAAAAVVLFLSLSKHMRKANAYARAHGIEVPERRGIAFRRDDAGDDAGDDVAGSPAVASPAGSDGAADDGPDGGAPGPRGGAAGGGRPPAP